MKPPRGGTRTVRMWALFYKFDGQLICWNGSGAHIHPSRKRAELDITNDYATDTIVRPVTVTYDIKPKKGKRR